MKKRTFCTHREDRSCPSEILHVSLPTVKYFKSKENRNWVFSGQTSDGKQLQLVKAADIPIKRHIRIRTDSNPYDPQDERYFDQRLTMKWRSSEKGNRKLNRIWKRQDGKCLVCSQMITDTDQWELHHIIHRVDGGSDNLTNLALLHPNCHRQVHSFGKSLTLLDPAKGL